MPEHLRITEIGLYSIRNYGIALISLEGLRSVKAVCDTLLL